VFAALLLGAIAAVLGARAGARRLLARAPAPFPRGAGPSA
jgi:hypothetical protein